MVAIKTNERDYKKSTNREAGQRQPMMVSRVRLDGPSFGHLIDVNKERATQKTKDYAPVNNISKETYLIHHFLLPLGFFPPWFEKYYFVTGKQKIQILLIIFCIALRLKYGHW